MPLGPDCAHVQNGGPPQLLVDATRARRAGTSVTDGHDREGAAARTGGVGRGRGRDAPAGRRVSRERLSDVVAQHAGTPPPAEMLVSGIIPPLADAYFQRLETGVDLKAGLFPGETVVLTHGEETEAAACNTPPHTYNMRIAIHSLMAFPIHTLG